MANIKFKLDGCDISFNAIAPEDITLKQLLKQADKIKPSWCACGIRSEDFDDNYLDIIFDYDSVKKANEGVCCQIIDPNEKIIKVGDIVKIIDTGKLYTTLDENHVPEHLRLKYAYNDNNVNQLKDVDCEVIYIYKHKTDGCTLCAIKPVYDIKIYIIDIKGLKLGE